MSKQHFSEWRSEVLGKKRAGPCWKRLATDKVNVLPRIFLFQCFHKHCRWSREYC